MNTEEELGHSLRKRAAEVRGGIEFTDVQQRAGAIRRRRQGRVVAALAAVAVLAIAVPFGLSEGDAPAPPTSPAPPRPSITTSPPGPDAEDPAQSTELSEEILADPVSRVYDLAVSSEDPQVRATAWARRTANSRQIAVVVTSDGFATRSIAALPGTDHVDVQPAGDGFVVNDGHAVWLVSPTGDVRQLGPPDGESPLAELEAFSCVSDAESADLTCLGIDPVEGTSHLVPVPEDLHFVVRTSSGELHAYTAAGDSLLYVTSDDGGAGWRREDLPIPGLYDVVDSATDQGPILVEGGDGATLFPLEWRFDVGPDGIGPALRISGGPDGEMAYGDPLAVLPDGDLLLAVESWSDATLLPRKFETSPGLYRHNAANGMQLVEVGAPFDEENWQPHIIETVVQPDSVQLYAVRPEDDTVWSSADAGRTWTEVRAR